MIRKWSVSNIANIVLLASAVIVFSGCALQGKWSVAQVDPDAARRDFEFTCLTLQRDGTFYAEANEPTGIKTTSGTYTYADGVLDLIAHDGERHTYDATLVSGNELQLASLWQGRRLLARLEREE